VLKNFLDGAHNDYKKASYAAYELGVQQSYGIAWGHIQAAQP